MPTKSATLRLLLSVINDVGDQPEKEFDESLVLDSFATFTPGGRLLLAAAGADVAVTFTDAIGLLIFSHDNAFSLRLAAGEALLGNLRCHLFFCDDEIAGAHVTSVLLTGNTVTPSDIEYWIIEKP